MEGLDLFNPVNRLATEDDSPSPTPSPYNDYWDDDEEEEEEEEGEMSEGNDDMEMEDDEGDIDYIEPATRQRRSTELALRVGKTRNGGEGEDGGEGVDMTDGLDTSFHVEKQQGLKLTFRKRGRQEMSTSENSSEPPVTKVS